MPDDVEMKRLLTLRDPGKIKLIALGFDWQRKGMAKAIEVAGELQKRGLDVELRIVGCQPPAGLRDTQICFSDWQGIEIHTRRRRETETTSW